MHYLKKYKHLISLLAIVAIAAVSTLALNAPVAVGIGIIGCWQLSQFALSKKWGVCFIAGLTPEQVKEFDGILKDLAPLKDFIPGLEEIRRSSGGFEAFKQLPAAFDRLESQVRSLRKSGLNGGGDGVRKNAAGQWVVGDSCANYLGSMFALRAIQTGKIKGSIADNFLVQASSFLGLEQKAAIATTDIPLPVAYAQQIVELVYVYGAARKFCTVYPLGGNSMKLPRLKTGEPQFAFIGVSGTVPEKVPQSEWITFTPGKLGGVIRIPSEIDEDSIFDLGQFVARYIAREMAYMEDYCLFLGDGTSTYNSINGIGAQATADSNVYQIPTGGTHPSDITLTQCRTLRTKVTGAVLGTARYFAHPTMEALFVTYNTSATVIPYVRRPDGTATLDGFPIEWISIMPAYTTSATVSAYQLAFGDLSWWYFGSRRDMDVQTSRDIYFATDEVGVRALERFDIHAMGLKSTTALQLAAS